MGDEHKDLKASDMEGYLQCWVLEEFEVPVWQKIIFRDVTVKLMHE